MYCRGIRAGSPRHAVWACLVAGASTFIAPACIAVPAPKSRPAPPTSTASLPAKIPILLAQDGKALLPIVIATDASDATKAVAAELAEYLKRISNATFEITTGDGSSGIVLGTLKDFPIAALKKPLEIRNRYDGVEAYAIRTQSGRVLLLGNTDLGVSHAAFRFLETLGCRWFFPAREWEVIPSKSTLRVALEEISRPVFLSRRIWWSYGFVQDADDPNRPPNQWRSWRDWEGWKRHNRMAASFTVYAAHAYGEIIEQNQKVFDAHPEYYALLSGKRVGWKMCLSNPAVRRMAVDYALNYFQKHPTADMVSFEPTDGGGWCECEECAKLGSVSDRAFGLSNEAARALQKDFPGKMVGQLAYFLHSDPPSFALEPNVHVQLATLYTQGKYTFDQQLELWPQRSKNLGIYDYLSSWGWNQDKLRPWATTGPAASIEYLKTNIPRFGAHGARSYDAESSNAWGQYGIGYYITNKLLWDPKANIDALLADFYDKAFGPATPAMKRFYERISPDSKPLFGTDLLARAFRDLDEAAQLAVGKPDIQARIDALKEYMRFNQLCWMVDEAANDNAKQKELALKLLEHSYRTRYAYMSHAAAMIAEGSRGMAEKFAEPSWSYWTPGKKPWQVEEFYTHDEIEKDFQDGLQYFQPQNIEEKKFSNDLVPVELPSRKPPEISSYIKWMDSTQFLQGPARIALYSLKGEPLDIGLIQNRLNGTTKLLDANEKVLETEADMQPLGERMQGEDKVRAFQFKVPKLGLYYLDIQRAGIGLNAKTPAVIMTPRGRNIDSYVWGGDGFYFYVPKGTRQIQYHYFWSEGPHKIFNPDNEVVKEIKDVTGYVTIPVPEGMDGKVWGFAGRLGQIWFYNCPNFLSALPDSLMVPRELAEKDGLTIRQ